MVFMIGVIVLFCMMFYCAEQLLVSRGKSKGPSKAWKSTTAWIIYMVIILIFLVLLWVFRNQLP